MSKAPTPAPAQGYKQPPQKATAYYYEDPEGYVGDYSESDAISEAGNANPMHVVQRGAHDVTELYRRKNGSMTPQEVYSQKVYIPTQEQIYDGLSSDYISGSAPNVLNTPIPQNSLQSSFVQEYDNRPITENEAIRCMHEEQLNIQNQLESMHASLTQPYYYEQPIIRMKTPRLPVPPTAPVYHKRLIVQQPQVSYYNENMTYQQLQQQEAAAMYRESLSNVAAEQSIQPNTPSTTMMLRQQHARKHPITVRTPRYVRRVPGMPTAVYKRPSALCLPLACQQDPTYRRIRRVQPTDPVAPQQELYPTPSRRAIGRRHSFSAPIYTNGQQSKIEPKKSLDMSKSRLDAILERYEKMFGKENEGAESAMMGDQEVFKHLKPRIPPCIKEKQHQSPVRITKDQIPEIIRTAETLQAHEVNSEILDELLAELTEHGFNDIVGDNEMKKLLNKTSRGAAKPENVDNGADLVHKTSQTEMPVKDKDPPKSYNYQEIKDNLVKSNPDYTSESDISKKEVAKKPPYPITNLEDAMELHRTKSYVVNLIDTALSNHFGTNVCEKGPTKDCMDARSAVEMLKKHSSGKLDKEMYREIAQVLSESYTTSQAVSGSQPLSDPKSGSHCACNKSQIDEPVFVKQLKQMRWGHLKHIQREVRRLEDLERFLESYNIASFDKCNQ